MAARCLLAALVAMLVLPTAATAAATPTTTSQVFDISGPYFSECAGEIVFLTGRIHILSHSVVGRDGAARFVNHVNYVGLRGVGETTGTRYVSPSSFTHTFSQNAAAGTVTATNMLRLISRGAAPDEVLRSTFHSTVNANGELTVVFNKVESGCV